VWYQRGISGGVGNSKVGNIQAVLAGIAAGVIDIQKVHSH